MNAQNNLSTQQFDTIKQDLQKVIVDAQQKFNLVGLSAAFLLSGQLIPFALTTGKTSIENGKSVGSTTLFQIGSITKTFTAVLIMKAINEKHLSFDDKLDKFFPEYILWKNITIGEMLNHASGIFDYIYSKDPNDWRVTLSEFKHKIWDAKFLVNIAYQHTVKFSIATKTEYSNTNYVLLGMILEKITHKSIDNLMFELIQHANLHHTYYLPKECPKSLEQQMTHGYAFHDVTGALSTQNGSIWHAAGAMVSSPEDLVYWMHILFTTNLINGLSITHYLRLKNTVGEKGIEYDCGLMCMNTPEGVVWFSPGSTAAYLSGMVYVPCLDLYFAYSTNTSPAKGYHEFIMMQIIRLMNGNEDYQKILHANYQVPAYCSQIKPAKKFMFQVPWC